jgi:hypothetical protein
MVGFQPGQTSTVAHHQHPQPTSRLVESGKLSKRPRHSHNPTRQINSYIPTFQYSAAASPSLPNGHGRSFPPTPPFNSRESVPHVSEHLSNGTSTSVAARSSGNASKSQRSPPTPEVTPPASLSPPQRLIPSRLSGSVAESFKTAREDPWLSADDVSTEPDISSLAMKEGTIDRHLGLGFEEELDHTPKQSRIIHESTLLNDSPPIKSSDHIPDREWDTNLMRNVTIRRKRNRPKQGDIGDGTAHQPVKPIIIDAPLPEGMSQDSPSTPRGDAIRKIKHAARRTSIESQPTDTRRLSGTSNVSVVEAIIVSTPPAKPRTLRHVSKTSSLRSDADSAVSSPISSTARASIDSSDLPLRRFSQLRVTAAEGRGPAPHVERHIRVSTDPLLRHQRDSQSLRAEALSNGLQITDTPAKRRSTSAQLPSPTRSGTIYSRHTRDSSPLSSPTSNGHRVTQDTAQDHRRKHATNTRDSIKSSSYHSIRSSTQQALQNALGPSLMNFSSSTNDSLVTIIKKASGDLSSTDAVTALGRKNDTEVPRQSQVSARASDGLLAPPLGNAFGSSLDRRPSDASGKSFNRSDLFEGRRSVDRSTLLSEDHPRHLYSQTTPFSQISNSDALELNEATAINLYPHTNHSLLVVEQGKQSRPETEHGEKQIIKSSNQNPSVAVQPSTPPGKQTEFVVDSPLKNPRRPPNPPVIQILPATPGQEEDNDPLNAVGSALPQRRPSLLQRARRYSDNIIQLGRSSSLRRRNSERTRSKPQEPNDAHLHPFWHPRNFWDDISDSDSEFDDEDFDRLPPGGDTSDPPPPSLPRRLTQKLPGFRGTGGFLIGNSLGLGRHGTNVRRHHVTLPSNFQPNPARLSTDRPTPDTIEPARAGASAVPSRAMNHKGSLASLRSVQARQRRMRRQFHALGLHIEYIGIGGVKDIWRERRQQAREKKLEKRRDEIRRSIGPKFYLENGVMKPWVSSDTDNNKTSNSDSTPNNENSVNRF